MVNRVILLDTGPIGLITNPKVVIATTNVGNLSRFIAADLWQNI